MKKFYITTTTPYVNADPHIGFALEILQADAIARYKRLSGFDVCFNWGTDEHGLKIYRKALEQHKDPKTYCDEYAARFKELIPLLNLSSTNFIRTTDPYHLSAAQEFWKRCDDNGDIYKKNYRVKYCVGCELEKTDSELVNNRCTVHPTLELEVIEEENYFFRFSKYQKKLLAFYQKNSDFVIPNTRYNELKSFVKGGLEDFSISRLKKKMPWGVDVPNDPSQVMYVWFDALVNYISTIGWPDDQRRFESWWPVVQIAGKDNLRQQAAIWQAMLMSAGIAPSKQIFIHGFITSEGQRMSKTLGNVVSPFDLVKKYGLDPVRYYLLREIPPYSDGDFSYRRFEELYNSDLANGLGNLIARVARLVQTNNLDISKIKFDRQNQLMNNIKPFMDKFQLDEALKIIWGSITGLNQYIDRERPWEQRDKEVEKTLSTIIIGSESIISLLEIAECLKPFLPSTSETILKQFSGKKITLQPPLFPRIK